MKAWTGPMSVGVAAVAVTVTRLPPRILEEFGLGILAFFLVLGGGGRIAIVWVLPEGEDAANAVLARQPRRTNTETNFM
ncbi:MAG: hypothetical protein SGARI_002937, partial [Bacillariaceae sp.]